MTAVDPIELRVLTLAPTTRDSKITHSLLSSAGISSLTCQTLDQLIRELQAGAAALVLSERPLASENLKPLVELLSAQPPWSDLPIILMVPGGVQSPAATRAMNSLTNVTLLERPAPTRLVLSAVRAAVRARQRQYQLREQIELLRQASRMKDEFLATLSHELRTPLNAILGWSQLIRTNAGDRDLVEEGLAIIERNSRVQVQLIEDLLDMSRIVSGKIRLDVRTIDPSAFIEAAIETVRPAAEARGINLVKVLDPHAGPIAGDSSRLQQVVWNLLSNAIKFTPKAGRVQVVLQRINSHIELSVSDTGSGIGPEFLPHVFERFRQADSSSTRSHGGLGLGLAIVKHFVELHGGTVHATSPGPEKGSTFTVTLPIAIAHHNDGEARIHPRAASGDGADCVNASLNNLKVLVVDDEPDARGLIKRMLEDCHAKVLTAATAAEGLELVEAERPDVVISDIGMPMVDGYDFLRQVRALGAERGGRVAAVALTAFARSEDRTRALMAGYQVHVSKPVEPQELIATVASVAGVFRRPAEPVETDHDPKSEARGHRSEVRTQRSESRDQRSDDKD
ncbi:MAG TPA: ATP-binding protein [Tepidisphaeraceae bacterium]|nr:ATP-binding protein [Tepidisphaeraceae bacterium]